MCVKRLLEVVLRRVEVFKLVIAPAALVECAVMRGRFIQTIVGIFNRLLEILLCIGQHTVRKVLFGILKIGNARIRGAEQQKQQESCNNNCAVSPEQALSFRAFGGGSLHFCGRGYQHLDNILAVEDVRVVNTSPMANHGAFGQFKRGLGEGLVIQLQDIAPIDVEDYYRRLFAEIDDLRGLMLATFVVDSLGMEPDGGYVTVEWQPFEIARRVVDVVRDCVAKKLAGEPLT